MQLSLLLKDSLMPPSPKAAVLTTLSPCTEDVPESVAALNFSARCFAATSRGQLGLPTSVSDALQVALLPCMIHPYTPSPIH